jgi:hypothetical protein
VQQQTGRREQSQEAPKGESGSAGYFTRGRTTSGSSSSLSTAATDSRNSSSRSSREPNSSRYNPGRAFLQAGMPPGLWVLPLSATAEQPPAPPPVAPEGPQQLLQVGHNC